MKRNPRRRGLVGAEHGGGRQRAQAIFVIQLVHGLEQARPAKPLFDLRQLHLHHFARGHKRHEDHEIIHPAHAFAAEGNVINRQLEYVAWSQF